MCRLKAGDQATGWTEEVFTLSLLLGMQQINWNGASFFTLTPVPSESHSEMCTHFLAHSLASELCYLCCCQYTGRFRGNVTYFRRTFLRLNYISIIKDTYIQSWTFTEILISEECGLLTVACTVPVVCYMYTALIYPWAEAKACGAYPMWSTWNHNDGLCQTYLHPTMCKVWINNNQLNVITLTEDYQVPFVASRLQLSGATI
jgi:hypothetical protein